MPVSLSASELALIHHAAAPLDRNRRDAFIEAVLAALEGVSELGPGVVHRVHSRDAAAILGASGNQPGQGGPLPWSIEITLWSGPALTAVRPCRTGALRRRATARLSQNASCE